MSNSKNSNVCKEELKNEVEPTTMDNADDDNKDNESTVVEVTEDSRASSEGEINNMQWNQEKARHWDPYEDGNYRLIYCEEPNEVNFMGGLGPNVGHPRSKVYIKRPTAVQQIYNMRTKNRHIYTFCEDPRETHNVPIKKVKVTAADVLLIEKNLRRVKLADNVDTPPSSAASERSAEVIVLHWSYVFDYENPLALDFQGLDHKETIRNDEQILQNRREYFIQNRFIKKCMVQVENSKRFEDDERQKKLSLPEYYDPESIIEGDEHIHEDTSKGPEDWRLKYRSTDGYLKFSRPIPEAIPFVPQDPILGRLVRTRDKVENINKMAEEEENRVCKFTNLEVKRKKKAEAILIEEANEKARFEENLVMEMGEKDFEDYFKDEYAEVLNTYKSLPPVYKEKKYPHTLRETAHLKCKLNDDKQAFKDKQLAKAEFLGMHFDEIQEEHENTVGLPCAPESISEQSTDDDDALSIGHGSDDKFLIRGFHYKLDDEPRGKLDVKHKSKLDRPPRGCLTRDEWFKKLAPQKQVGSSFFKKNLSSIPCQASPNSENYIFFEPEKIMAKPIEISPIKEVICNMTVEPKVVEQAGPNVKKPKYVQVKKFNLTGYLFGTEKRKRQRNKKTNRAPGTGFLGSEVTTNYEQICNAKIMAKKKQRHNRMKVLGIPFATKEEQSDRISDSESSSSDWVPDIPKDEIECDSSIPKPQRLLKQHPRRKQFADTRICIANKKSTESIDSRYPYDASILKELAKDVILPPNLDIQKTDFTHLFKYRHHHEHYDQTQHKKAYVKYQPKVPRYKVPKFKVAKLKTEIGFDRAYPRGRDGVLDMDRTIPKGDCVPDRDNIQEHENKNVDQVVTRRELKLPPTNAISTRTQTKSYPEKQRFLDLLRGKNETYKKLNLQNDEEVYQWFIDKDKYLEQLKVEIDSILSCNTSHTSSVCTNFTEDSGSYLLVEGTKVPCDFITKPEIPFAERNRCRVKAQKVEHHDEYYGPYYYVPFSGQRQDMRLLTQPKDKFFTSSTRSRFGIRNRLKVTAPKFQSEFIGTKEAKYISHLATEWDEYYINEIKTRPRIRRCKPITMVADARNSLRYYFESLYIQHHVTVSTIAHNKEVQYAEEVQRFRDICNPLFSRWEELHYRRYMRKMQEVKPFYDRTDQLKKQLKTVNNRFIKLDMRIMLEEDKWQNRVILQNFHYLLQNQTWREENDWMHRLPDGSQQDYCQAIALRNTTNVRVRDEDSCWATKAFYDNVYQKHPVLIVFPDPKTFMAGILKLKAKTFVSLLELHFSMWIQSDLENELNTFNKFAENYISKRSKYVKGRCAKKYFIEDRVSQLKNITMDLMDKPLLNAISDKILRKVTAICECLFQHIIPKNIKDNMKEGAEVLEQFKLVVDHIMNLFEKRDEIPAEIRKRAEQRVKTKLAFTMRQAKRACSLESRINTVIVQMKKNLAPPYKPPRPKGKLPRSCLPIKKKIVKVELVEMSEMNKLFYRAFTDLDPKEYKYQIAEPEMDIAAFMESNCIPFYFDFFLRQHDYYPVYDFKTEIELHEGSEMNRFVYRDVINEVVKNLDAWEIRKQKEIDKNIAQTLHLYVEPLEDDGYDE